MEKFTVVKVGVDMLAVALYAFERGFTEESFLEHAKAAYEQARASLEVAPPTETERIKP